MSARCPLRLSLTVVAVLVFGACATEPPPGPPALPIVKPVGRAEPPAVSEAELVADALRQARHGESAAAARTIAGIRDAALRTRVAANVARDLAQHDPAAAAALAAALPAGAAQSAAIEHAFPAWARRDADAALRWAIEFPDPAISRTAQRAVAGELMRTDPRATISRIMAREAGRARDDALVIAAAEWARFDPSGAEAWLGELSDDPLKQRLTSSIGFEIAQHDPNRAIALADTLPAGRDRWLLLAAIAQTWVAVDPKAALSWAHQLPAGEPRDAAFAGIDTGFGVPSERRVARAPRGSSPRIRGGTAAVATWSGAEPPGFALWLKTQPRDLSREEAVLEYVRQRGALEADAVGQWLATMPGGMTRDRAMEIYVDNLVATSPTAAANWLRSLPRSERSDRMIEKTAERMLLTNPAAAEAWLRDSGLPPARQEEVLRRAGVR